MERCPFNIIGHRRLKFVTEFSQLDRKVEDNVRFLLMCQEVTITTSSWSLLMVSTLHKIMHYKQSYKIHLIVYLLIYESLVLILKS